jgi:hypothetical protein
MHTPEGYQASGRERGAVDQQAVIQPDGEPLKALLLRLRQLAKCASALQPPAHSAANPQS